MRRAVFLDRDGTINAMAYDADHGLVDSPATPEAFHLLPGAADAIRLLNEAGFVTVAVSNQPGIAKGRFTSALLDAVTHRMHVELARRGARLGAVFYCLHHPEAVREEFRALCTCRKPRPGLLLRSADVFGIDLQRSYMIGDGVTDVQAGAAAGCRTVWLGKRRCDVCDVMAREGACPDFISPNLLEAVQGILRREGGSWKSFSTRPTCER